MILTKEVVSPIKGIDMATGVQIGFFGPTNKENAVGVTRSNFLMPLEDRIPWPVFCPKKPEHVVPTNPTPPPPPVNKEGYPSKAVYWSICDVKHSGPKDYFDLQLLLGYMQTSTKEQIIGHP